MTTECGMRGVLASIYNEGVIYGAKIRRGIWEQQDTESANFDPLYNLHDPNIRNVIYFALRGRANEFYKRCYILGFEMIYLLFLYEIL